MIYKEYGKGYSKRNLEYIGKVAKEFSTTEFAQQPVAQIPWNTLIEILYKSKSHEEMLWYINKKQAKVIIKFINTYIDTFLNILSSFLILLQTEKILLTNKI